MADASRSMLPGFDHIHKNDPATIPANLQVLRAASIGRSHGTLPAQRPILEVSAPRRVRASIFESVQTIRRNRFAEC
jgi:hypothetical protein